MARFLTPGVYRLPPPAARPDIRLVRTDVAGFLGFAERGPLPSPDIPLPEPTSLAVRLSGWKEYQAIFGGFTPYGNLPFAVRAFFENGGTTCYVVRVAATHHPDPLQRPAAASFVIPTPDPPVDAATLTAAAPARTSELQVDSSQNVAQGDLVEIATGGVREYRIVAGKSDALRVRLARPLDSDHAAGTKLKKYAPALRFVARTQGNWGNRLSVTVAPFTTSGPVTEFSLRVRLEPGLDTSQTKQEEFYKRLSLVAPSELFAPTMVNDTSPLVRAEAANAAGLGGGGAFWRGAVGLQGGREGLSGLSALDFIGGITDFRGLRLIEEIDEIAILCAPDAVFAAPPVLPVPPPPRTDPCARPGPAKGPDPVREDPTAVPPALDHLTIQRALVEQCERLRDRVAILDPPDGLKPSQVAKWREAFATRFAALYYPWLKAPETIEVLGPTRRVPPSGYVAGVYARIDNQFGVHRPPANAALEFVVDLAEDVTALQQELLNPLGVNALRPFPGRGIRVFGARSLAALRAEEEDWRFIHARRLMSMIEESVEDSTQWAVFEPNDFSLRSTLVHSLSVFLEQIWRDGGLKGAIPAEGFFVKCDQTNNPPAVVDQGQLVCQVGVALAKPMEFLTFEVRTTPAGPEIVEA